MLNAETALAVKMLSSKKKISLREEAEMQSVRESVFLDWDNNKIVCTLQVRGAERDFLSTNKIEAQ